MTLSRSSINVNNTHAPDDELCVRNAFYDFLNVYCATSLTNEIINNYIVHVKGRYKTVCTKLVRDSNNVE